MWKTYIKDIVWHHVWFHVWMQGCHSYVYMYVHTFLLASLCRQMHMTPWSCIGGNRVGYVCHLEGLNGISIGSSSSSDARAALGNFLSQLCTCMWITTRWGEWHIFDYMEKDSIIPWLRRGAPVCMKHEYERHFARHDFSLSWSVFTRIRCEACAQ